ncbi:hypothetical protein [Deinococcus arenicola]|uniref:Lipoprotein n=1 Tax=Deinococcus arenicola TaxID=2994950 RepID=A0ABU4DTL7_9DEIO|nr:hypothetical protein [Deinococcus sp. ZS9-10]MDV6375718.1 hypothetical protein [Deinococcus sp. ZS9-10]
MTRIFAIVMGVMLVGCQQAAVTPASLPALRGSALGLTLTLKAQVENWPASLVANVVLERSATPENVIGSVTEMGVMSVSTTTLPPLTTTAVLALLGPAGPESGCGVQDVQISDAATRAFELRTLPLVQVETSPVSLRPQLSPPIPFPELRRQAGNSAVHVLYVDRDLRVVGTQVCSGEHVITGSRWQRASSVNVQLRAGWNLITVTSEYLGGKEGLSNVDAYQLTVEGGDRVVGTAWQYSGVMLDR